MSVIQQIHSNKKLPDFVCLIKHISDRLLQKHKRTYAFQIHSQHRLMYKGICTLADLLGYSSEREVIQIFITLGLFKRHGPQLRCNHDQWTAVANSCGNGVTYKKHYGQHRLNLLVLGDGTEPNYSIENQRDKGHTAIPLNIKWFKGIKK